MFQRNNIKIIKDLWLKKPVEESSVNWELDFFDREGYQLNAIEKEYHAVNDITIHTEDRMARRVSDDALNVVLQHWYTQVEKHPNIFIDHAHILHRFGFADDAQDQLVRHAQSYPKLRKMIFAKPKYGLDFAIDWIDDTQVVEMFHIELDCREYEVFTDLVSKIQSFIENTNWQEKGAELVRRKAEWVNLDEYQQAEFKAKLYGLHKIGIDYFTEHYLNKPYLFAYLKVID